MTSLFAEPPATDGVGFQSHPSRIGQLVWPSCSSSSEFTDATTGRELRTVRVLDAVFADEDGLMEALDYLMLSDLGPFEK